MTETSAPSAIDSLAERFWDGFQERNPLWATVLGDERWDDRLDDPTEAGRERELAAIDEVERGADDVDSPDLPTEDRITLGLLRVIIDTRREHHALRLWEMDGLDQMQGPQTLITELARFQRVDTPARLDRLLARLEAYPAYLAAHADNLAAGVRSGRTAARVPIERTISQTRVMVEAPTEASALLAAHPELAPADRERLGQADRPLGAPRVVVVPRRARGLPAPRATRGGPVLAAGRRADVPVRDPCLDHPPRDRPGSARPRPGPARGAHRRA